MKAETRNRKARHEAVKLACADEIRRVNEALDKGVNIVIETAFGRYVLDGVRDFDYYTHPESKVRDEWNRRTFMGCNDGTWAKIMRDAGEPRNPLFV